MYEGWTSDAPNVGFHGNGRHWFGTPDDEMMNKLMNKETKKIY